MAKPMRYMRDGKVIEMEPAQEAERRRELAIGRIHELSHALPRQLEALRIAKLNGGVVVNGERVDTRPEARERLLWAIQQLPLMGGPPRQVEGIHQKHLVNGAAIRNHIIVIEAAFEKHLTQINAIVANKRLKPEGKLKALKNYDLSAGW